MVIVAGVCMVNINFLSIIQDVSKVWSSVLTGGAQAKVVTDSAVSLVAIFTGQSISAAFQKDFRYLFRVLCSGRASV